MPACCGVEYNIAPVDVSMCFCRVPV